MKLKRPFHYAPQPLLGAIFFLTFAFIYPGAVSANPRFKAVAFDYFVIFDPRSVVPHVEKEFPGKGMEFTRVWQNKQFEYAFLRTITKHYEDFFAVTSDALDYAAASMRLSLTVEKRTRLMNSYLMLKPWPDSIPALKRLRAAGIQVITISNFTPKMLRTNADGAGITDLFDILVSTDEKQSFKPDAEAYALGLEKLHFEKDEIAFAAFGGWDAAGAKKFGYPTFWVNRFNLPIERLGVTPDDTSRDLKGLLDFVLGSEPKNGEKIKSD